MPCQAVKLFTVDIRPEQWSTGAGEENGFFDARANGPVSASDPGASVAILRNPEGRQR